MNHLNEEFSSADPETTADATTPSRSGDPLAAMYVLAALFMGIAAVVVVAMIFVPSDLFRSEPAEGVWRPGSGPGWAGGPAGDEFSRPPGLRRVGENEFVAVIDAFNWEFEPSEIRVPVGANVTFRARSRQDYHGFMIVNTPIMLTLGQNQVAEATFRFDSAGQYPIICSEYCGGGHAAMQGMLIVEGNDRGS